MIILIKLLLVHIIGDFFLQPKKWVKEKEQKKKEDQAYRESMRQEALASFNVDYDAPRVFYAKVINTEMEEKRKARQRRLEEERKRQERQLEEEARRRRRDDQDHIITQMNAGNNKYLTDELFTNENLQKVSL